MVIKYRLHKRIMKLILNGNLKDCIPFFDSACVHKGDKKKTRALTLYREKPCKTKTKSCNVDIILIKKDKVKVIIEIEESGINPDKICGKFFASFLSKYFKDYKTGDEYELDESVLFIQILKIINQKMRTIEKWKNLKENIQEFTNTTKNNKDFKDFKIKRYESFDGCQEEFNSKEKEKGRELIETIEKFIR